MNTQDKEPRVSGTFNASAADTPRKARKKIPPPFSIRFSDQERAELEEKAGSLTLGAYSRTCLFEGARQPPRKPIKDHEAMAHALALSGQSRLSSNLNQLAKAANMGALPVTPETE